jgi:hypothetical protein
MVLCLFRAPAWALDVLCHRERNIKTNIPTRRRKSMMTRTPTGIRYLSKEAPSGHLLPDRHGVGVEAPGWQYEPAGHLIFFMPFSSKGQ